MDHLCIALLQNPAKPGWRICTFADQGGALGDTVHGTVNWNRKLGGFIGHPIDGRRSLVSFGEELIYLVMQVGDFEIGEVSARVEEEPCFVNGEPECLDMAKGG
ncbi:hypothetical protein [Phaeobacter sp. JH20_12]